MKKIFAMLLALTMLASLSAGCNNNTKPVETKAPDDTTAHVATDPVATDPVDTEPVDTQDTTPVTNELPSADVEEQGYDFYKVAVLY